MSVEKRFKAALMLFLVCGPLLGLSPWLYTSPHATSNTHQANGDSPSDYPKGSSYDSVFPNVIPEVMGGPVSSEPGSAQGFGDPAGVSLKWTENYTFNFDDTDTGSYMFLGDGQVTYYRCNISVGSTSNRTIPVEDSVKYLDGFVNPGLPHFVSFEIPSDLRVYGFSIYLKDSQADADYAIFNSSWDSLKNASYPDAPILNYTTASSGGPKHYDHWFTWTFSNVLLNTSETDNNTFFMALQDTGGKWNWYYSIDGIHGDDPDESYVYYYDTAFNIMPWDLFLKVLTRAPADIPSPSQVQMAVNGTTVLDTGSNQGYMETTPYLDLFSRQLVLFNVSAFWSTTYNITISANTTRAESVQVEYAFYPGLNEVYWRYTWASLFPSGSSDKSIDCLVPPDYTPHNVTRNAINYTQWTFNGSNNMISITPAWDAVWTLLSSAPNYVVYIDTRATPGGPIIVESYINETIFVHCSHKDSFGVPVIDGNSSLTVFDIYDQVNYSIWMPPDGAGNATHPWNILATATENGTYTCQVVWSNGTEAGLNMTTIHVNWMPSNMTIIEQPDLAQPLTVGFTLTYTLNYTAPPWDIPLNSCVIAVTNMTNGMPWNSYLVINRYETGEPGLYDILIETQDAAVSVVHNISIFGQDEFYTPFVFNISFTLTGGSSSLTPIEGSGVTYNLTSGGWELNPHPMINDTAKSFQVIYLDEELRPITGASVTARLYYNRSHYTTLSVVDLYASGVGIPGTYEVRVDTNPIQGVSLGAFEDLNISIRATKTGYAPSPLIVVDTQVQPRIASILIPPQPFVYFTNWFYPTAFRVIIQDAITGKGLDHALVTYNSSVLGQATLVLMAAGTGFYEARNFTTSVDQGNYNLTIRADTTNYASVETSLSIPLYAQHHVEAILISSVPRVNPLVGDSFNLRARLQTVETGDPLPENTSVTLVIRIDGSEDQTIPLLTNSNGEIDHSIRLSKHGSYQFGIRIQVTEQIVGEEISIKLSVGGSAFNFAVDTLVGRVAPFAMIGVVSAAGGTLGYYQFYRKPRKMKKLVRQKGLANIFMDLGNIRNIIIIHKLTGLPVFNWAFSQEASDPGLISGFLQAIVNFSVTLERPNTAQATPPDSGGTDQMEEDSSPKYRLGNFEYQNLSIILCDGENVRVAVICQGSPSGVFGSRLQSFVSEYEALQGEVLQKWQGDMHQLKNPEALIELKFEVPLMYPHIVNPNFNKKDIKENRERSLFALSQELATEGKRIYLGELYKLGRQARIEDNPLDVLEAIYELHNKKALQPVEPPHKSYR